MDQWVIEFRRKVEAQGIKIYLLKKYVDDVLTMTSRLKKGSRWINGSVVWTPETESQDQSRTEDEVTMEVLRSIASSVFNYLKFTAETSGGEDNPLPCLDTQFWVGTPSTPTPWHQGQPPRDQKVPGSQERIKANKTILYWFFSKPMANPLCIMRRSGVPEGTKVSTAVAELLRRWKTTSVNVETREVEKITRQYMDNLTAMGYTHEWRCNVVRSALTGYQRVLHKETLGQTRRNRHGHHTARKRRFQKLCGAAEW